jgi:hypothetical protein
MYRRIFEIPPNVFWRHGYHFGYADGKEGLPNRLDEMDRQGEEGASDVVELRPQSSLPEQRTPREGTLP